MKTRLLHVLIVLCTMYMTRGIASAAPQEAATPTSQESRPAPRAEEQNPNQGNGLWNRWERFKNRHLTVRAVHRGGSRRYMLGFRSAADNLGAGPLVVEARRDPRRSRLTVKRVQVSEHRVHSSLDTS